MSNPILDTHPKALASAALMTARIHDATHIREPRVMFDNPDACRFIPCLPTVPVVAYEAARDAAFAEIAEGLVNGAV